MTTPGEAAIAAIATAEGPAGVAIVRVSGADAWCVAGRVLQIDGPPLEARRPGTWLHAGVVDPGSGEVVDDAVVLLFRAPASFTGEDAVEIQGHGGLSSPQRVLRAVLAAGARLAEPGEFSRRAFLNGRMDLTQAEAMLDLVNARTERAAQAARSQMAGRLAREVSACYERVVRIGASVAARLDLEDGEIPAEILKVEREELEAARGDVRRLIATWREGRLLRHGALVAIGGCPNAGKSSLLNALLGWPRAIVSSIPGTTRDTIEEPLVLAGIALRLVDTAGLREATCAVEREGVDRAHHALSQADLVLYVVDASRPLSDQHPRLFSGVVASDPGRAMVVLNKSDLLRAVSDDQMTAWLASWPAPARPPVFTVSALTGEGIEALRTGLAHRLGMERNAPVQIAVSERHRAELAAAEASLARCAERLDRDDDLVIVAQEMQAAAEALARITGRIYSQDLLDDVFGRFCVGK
jgi:tRNA modification GTPase